MVDESPRWLIASGQLEKAERVLKKAAKYNKERYNDKALYDEKTKYTESANLDKPLRAMWNNFVKEPVLLGYLAICVLSW